MVHDTVKEKREAEKPVYKDGTTKRQKREVDTVVQPFANRETGVPQRRGQLTGECKKMAKVTLLDQGMPFTDTAYLAFMEERAESVFGYFSRSGGAHDLLDFSERLMQYLLNCAVGLPTRLEEPNTNRAHRPCWTTEAIDRARGAAPSAAHLPHVHV